MTPNVRIALFSAAFVLLSSVQYACAADTLKLMVKGITVPVEVAADNANREKGLMFRKHLPENSGMLFVMDRSDAVCMWMKNTLIPLSVAFIDKDGFIIGLRKIMSNPETRSLAFPSCAKQIKKPEQTYCLLRPWFGLFTEPPS